MSKTGNNKLTFLVIFKLTFLVKIILTILYDNDQFVLLHHFRKKTQKTPKKEIVRAKNERDDYLNRKKGDRL